MNTPNRNTVAEMVLEWIGDLEALQQFFEHLYELGDWHFDGSEEYCGRSVSSGKT
jgi:hypothetical protein